MRGPKITCNVCGQVKGETNKWLIAITDPDWPRAVAFGSADDDVYRDDVVIEDICGEACAHIRLSRALANSSSTQEAH
jgi:hypothetical protein